MSAQGQLKRDFIKVKNFARQAAEKANGGLSNYRATSDMYDNTKLAPCEWKGTSFNAEKEERYVCVVMGGKPARIVKPTIKTVVAVTVRQSPWDIRVISNERNSNVVQQSEADFPRNDIYACNMALVSIRGDLRSFKNRQDNKIKKNTIEAFSNKLHQIQVTLQQLRRAKDHQQIKELRLELGWSLAQTEAWLDRLTTKPRKDDFWNEGSWTANEPVFMTISTDIRFVFERLKPIKL